MNRAEWEAMRADRARTQHSNRSLAKGRRGRPADKVTLDQEQESYSRRFAKAQHPSSGNPMAVISDRDGNYPDQHWSRHDR